MPSPETDRLTTVRVPRAGRWQQVPLEALTLDELSAWVAAQMRRAPEQAAVWAQAQVRWAQAQARLRPGAL